MIVIVMWLGILGVVTFITVIFTSRKWWLLTIIATMVGLYIPFWIYIYEPWTCQPTTTFPINPQSRILCAPEHAGLIGHWKNSPNDLNKELRTPKFYTLSTQQSITYASIYKRSAKLYNACIRPKSVMRWEIYGYRNICSKAINSVSPTAFDVLGAELDLLYEEREFYRQFPVLGDKRPWMD